MTVHIQSLHSAPPFNAPHQSDKLISSENGQKRLLDLDGGVMRTQGVGFRGMSSEVRPNRWGAGVVLMRWAEAKKANKRGCTQNLQLRAFSGRKVKCCTRGKYDFFSNLRKFQIDFQTVLQISKHRQTWLSVMRKGNFAQKLRKPFEVTEMTECRLCRCFVWEQTQQFCKH